MEETNEIIEAEIIEAEPVETLEKPRVKKPRTEKQILAFAKAQQTRLDKAQAKKELKEQAIYESVKAKEQVVRLLEKPYSKGPKGGEGDISPYEDESEDSVEYIPKRKCMKFNRSKSGNSPQKKTKPKRKKVVVYLSSSDESESETESESEEEEQPKPARKSRVLREPVTPPEAFNSHNYFV